MDALIHKGLALFNLGRSEEAIEYYDRALAIDPNATQTTGQVIQ
jgi:tetratricopeptide (TPR) repeat protein